MGDVMKESAETALSYVRSLQGSLYEETFHKDVHIHVTQADRPKDGPSGGLAICVALTSALLHRPIDQDLALSGEITLHGRVLPVGGVREKLLAAKRAGYRQVILPQLNKQEVDDLPLHSIEGLQVYYVKDASEAISRALHLDSACVIST
jgi:ATP-dependent Lon protease